MTAADLTYDERGLIPAVVQDAESGEVLMVAWMNRDAVEATLRTGVTHFWSRSRKAPWRKGETSGHTQHVQAAYADCDADVLLVQVQQDGAACHTGERSCFHTALVEAGEPAGDRLRIERLGDTGSERPATDAVRVAATMLERLESIVRARLVEAPAGSYVGGLLAKGEPAVCRKIGEEAVEVITAALGGDGDDRVVEEIADLWFHTVVLLGGRGIPVRDVLQELSRRHRQRTTAATE